VVRTVITELDTDGWPGQKIEERNFSSLKRTLPGVREPEYLGLAQLCFN
jgi:hypothetical protein